MDESVQDRDFVQSLARGLSVIRAFEGGSPWLTLAEVAAAAQISRPAARRVLLTLHRLGYVYANDGRFALSPRVLTLGQAFLSSQTLVAVAQPHLKDLTAATGEASGLAVLDGTEIVYVARVAADRIISSILVVGSRLPAYATSLGRVLLAHLPQRDSEELLSASNIAKLTPRTETDPQRLGAILDEVRGQGWSIVDQEMEEGLRSSAVPVLDHRGAVIAALGASCHASRVSREALHDEILPLVQKTASRITEALGGPP